MNHARRSTFVICLLALFALATSPLGTVDAQSGQMADASFQPDVRLAQSKTVNLKKHSAQARRFAGNDVYDAGGPVTEGLIVAAEPDQTQIYFLMVQNDGSERDNITFSFERVDVPDSARMVEPFTAAVYTTIKKKGRFIRGDDVTTVASGEGDTDGLTFDLRPRRKVVLWFEVQTSADLEGDDTARWQFTASSRGARAREIMLSSMPGDALRPPVRDRLFTQVGEPTGNGLDAVDLNDVRFAHIVAGYPQRVNIADWEITSELGPVTVSASKICVPHTKMGQWPGAPDVGGRPTMLEGNPWIIAEFDGKLWAGFWEWMLDNGSDRCKTLSSRPPATTTASEMADHIKAGPFGNWRPKKGDKVWFFVTSLAWPGIDSAQERTQVVGPIDWPF